MKAAAAWCIVLLWTPGALAQTPDSARARAATYPEHLARIVAPLRHVRTTALCAAGVVATVAVAHTQDAACDRWVQDDHTLGSAADFASNTLPAILFAAYVVPHLGSAIVRGDGRGVWTRTEGLVEALAVQGLLVEGIKHATDRDRPNGNKRSFPSGHTAYAFTMAGLTDAAFGAKFGVPAYAAATFVGASRISLRRHWLSDVAAGAALGATIGELVGREHKKGEDDPRLAAGWLPGGPIVLRVTVPLGR